MKESVEKPCQGPVLSDKEKLQTCSIIHYNGKHYIIF